MPTKVSKPTLERLSKYRRFLLEEHKQRKTHVYSHDLAALLGVTASLVRRDMMVTGCMGNPSRGYDIDSLLEAIGHIVDADTPDSIALVGLGKLGSALLDYFQSRRPNLRIVAAFDTNPDKVNRIYHSTHCYPLDDLGAIVKDKQIHSGIIAVPGDAAQDVANRMIISGIMGILNFAPVRLHVPGNVYVEAIDLTTMLEKTIFFARQNACRTT